MVSSVRFRYQSLSEIITFMTIRGLQQIFYRQRKIILSRIDWFSLSRVCFEQRTSKAGKINLFSRKGFGVNNGSIWKSNYPFITLSNEKKERRNLPLANNSGQLTLIGRLSETLRGGRAREIRRKYLLGNKIQSSIHPLSHIQFKFPRLRFFSCGNYFCDKWRNPESTPLAVCPS